MFDFITTTEIVDLRLDAGFYQASSSAFARFQGAKDSSPDRILAAGECVTMAAMCLEAYINHQYDRAQANGAVRRLLEVAMERLNLREKWECLPLFLGGQPFAKNRRPWQTFEELIKLRNELVHFRVSAWQIVNLKPKIRDVAILLDETKVTSLFGCVRAMIEELGALLGVEASPQSPFPWLSDGEKVERFRDMEMGVRRYTRTEHTDINPTIAACYFCDKGLTGDGVITARGDLESKRYLICGTCFKEMEPDLDFEDALEKVRDAKDV